MSKYTYVAKKERTAKLFGLHTKVQSGKLKEETALKRAVDELGYTQGGAASWFSWWKARAKEALGLDDNAKFSARHQARLAKRLKDTAGKMKAAAADKPAMSVRPASRAARKRA